MKRNTVAFTVALVLAASSLASVAMEPAFADGVRVAFRISRVVELESQDGDGGDGDWYARVQIGSNPVQESSEESGDDIRPRWIFTGEVDPTDGPVLVTVQLFDEDDFIADGDDHADIDGRDHDLDLEILYDPVQQTWEGEVPRGVTFSEGDGDHDFPEVNDGRRAHIEFDFVTGATHFDTDGDGIPDVVERFGIRDADGTMITDLAGRGADPCRKTIVVVADYMFGAADGHSHVPQPDAIAELRDTFDAAPLPAVDAASCPYAGFPLAPTGVDMVFVIGKTVGERPEVSLDDMADIRDANLDPRIRPYAHYVLFAHGLEGKGSTSGQCCEDDRDFLVTLGFWTGQGSVPRDQAGTTMHELGHALGLGHGGQDSDGDKDDVNNNSKL
jgi:hypothetical protein